METGTVMLDMSQGGAVRLDQSRWWQQRRMQLYRRRLAAQAQGTTASDSSSLVSCCLQLTIQYWEHLQATGELDRSGRVSVLQWGAGTGTFVFRMLRGLRERLAVSALAGLAFRYVVCEEDANAIEQLLDHPYFRDDIEAGRLVLLHVTEPAKLREAAGQCLSASAPLVAIANDVLLEAQQALLGFVDGNVFDADVIDARDDEADSPRLQWGEAERIHRWPSAWQSLVSTYSQRLDNVAVSLPTGALTFIDAVSQLAGGRYLLLACDIGIDCERQLRAGACAVAVDDAAVNFDALSRYQRERGALTWNSAADPQGRVLHVALNDVALRARDDVFRSLLHSAHQYAPGAMEALFPVMASYLAECTCEQLLAAVHASHEDPRMLAIVIEPLLARLDSLSIECCMQWRSTLQRVWNRYFPVVGDDTLCLDIGTLALHIGPWGVARAAFEAGLLMQGENADLLHRLSYCEASTGHGETALALMQRACALEPQESVYRESVAILRARIAAWSATLWFRRSESTDGELSLEPLGAEHALSLLFQYRDPQIAAMTRLPELIDRDGVLAWIDEQRRESGRAQFAVMHACWGFVGVVSMRSHDDGAYFYFWVGADYQGQGLGQRAARLLFRQATLTGINHIFTSAYRSNRRSCEALRRLGLQQLKVTATAPDEDLIFFHQRTDRCDVVDAHADVREPLVKLLAAIGSPIVIAPPGPVELPPARVAESRIS